MNQKVKELAEKADIKFFSNGAILPGRGEKDLQKFAELIIYECLRIVKDCDRHAEDEVLNHFGILDKNRF
jgi:hypothetical protein